MPKKASARVGELHFTLRALAITSSSSAWPAGALLPGQGSDRDRVTTQTLHPCTLWCRRYLPLQHFHMVSLGLSRCSPWRFSPNHLSPTTRRDRVGVASLIGRRRCWLHCIGAFLIRGGGFEFDCLSLELSSGFVLGRSQLYAGG